MKGKSFLGIKQRRTDGSILENLEIEPKDVPCIITASDVQTTRDFTIGKWYHIRDPQSGGKVKNSDVTQTVDIKTETVTGLRL